MIGLVNFYKKEKDRKIKQLKEFLESEEEVILIEPELPLDVRIENVILSGSERLITEGEFEEEWFSFIEECNKQVLGICFGFQLICKKYGSVFEHGEKIKELNKVFKLREHPIIEDLPEECDLPESHEEYVTAIMEPLIPLMSSNSCIEAVMHRKRPIYGTQFHFERSKEYGKIILKNFLGLKNSH